MLGAPGVLLRSLTGQVLLPPRLGAPHPLCSCANAIDGGEEVRLHALEPAGGKQAGPQLLLRAHRNAKTRRSGRGNSASVPPAAACEACDTSAPQCSCARAAKDKRTPRAARGARLVLVRHPRCVDGVQTPAAARVVPFAPTSSFGPT